MVTILENVIESLRKYAAWAYRCGKERTCHFVNYHKLGAPLPICPSGEYFKYEAYYGSGRLETLRAIAERDIKEPSERLLEIIYACTVCGGCRQQCKGHVTQGTDVMGIDHVEAFEALRTVLSEELGWGPLPAQKAFAESIKLNHNPYNEPHEKRRACFASSDVGEPPVKNAEVIYFVGCTSSYREPSIAVSTVKLLKAAGVDFGVMSDEWCCGSPLLRTGQKSAAVETAKHNVETLKQMGVKTVIFSCAGCYRTFKEDYPQLFGDLGFECLHVSEYLPQLVKEGKLKFKEIQRKVTYHDPCHLGRHLGFAAVYEPPRELVKAVPGVELVEMKRNREQSWCCGSGGGVKAAFDDFAVWTAIERLKEVEETGAQTLVTPCPFCVHNFKDAVAASGKSIEVLDLVELLANAL
ncbi:MAG: Fe-S cluster-containing oxidoreductase [Candidatus Alkanophagales archaeon MCA70_species_2]|nr:Fe-S cluster-containing oxidoreductase [Candidatus Alkanophaga liquidiphilum]